MRQKTIANIEVLLSALCFALAGVLIKFIPWSSLSIQVTRCMFALPVMLLYMKLTHHRFVFNRAVVLIGVGNTAMSTTFVLATKMTTAANAVILNLTAPIFVILLMWVIWKKKPDRTSVIACVSTFIGIIFFFLDDLSFDNMVGNVVGLISGFCYTAVFLGKTFKDSDFESGIALSYIINIFLWSWSLATETEFSLNIWILVICLGVFQYSLSYIFLSRGLDHVSAVTASLLSMIEPIANPILVAVFYGEMIGREAFIGAIIVMGAITWYSIKERGA